MRNTIEIIVSNHFHETSKNVDDRNLWNRNFHDRNFDHSKISIKKMCWFILKISWWKILPKVWHVANIFVGGEISTGLMEISVVEISRTEIWSSKKFDENFFLVQTQNFVIKNFGHILMYYVDLYAGSEISIRPLEISMVEISLVRKNQKFYWKCYREGCFWVFLN